MAVRWRQQQSRRVDAAGFTLVELMVTLAIFVAVMTLVFTQVSTSLQQTAAIDASTASAAASRLAIDQLVTELRQSGTGDIAVPAVDGLSATTVTMYTPDRGEPMRMRKVMYRKTGASLERAEILSTNSGAAPWTFPALTPAWRVVLIGVTNNDLFAFSDDDGDPTTDPADVVNVELNFVLQSKLTGSASTTFSTDVNIRSTA